MPIKCSFLVVGYLLVCSLKHYFTQAISFLICLTRAIDLKHFLVSYKWWPSFYSFYWTVVKTHKNTSYALKNLSEKCTKNVLFLVKKNSFFPHMIVEGWLHWLFRAGKILWLNWHNLNKSFKNMLQKMSLFL